MRVAITPIVKTLPRVSMARIPVVAFANSHPSAYSSSTWAESAKTKADNLEQAAKNIDQAENSSGLSHHASEAIRLLESHSALKQDKATIHTYHDVDHGEARYVKH
ncbi:hypothetical protein BGZ80_009747 [Entomortierella chlamydospora]|uniref:Uncharacterized protein n=1 Tax=Entomortierella chlamydospora TaxID=101097 RepID=A0A9P6T0V9_9FUNG|nr:hypothetical protein BGZ79_009523 [Entomortierella chlamydospora]KAG0015618.1 hypothetical protein BGZ80_009747 [Entomortierella chlamydospora]